MANKFSLSITMVVLTGVLASASVDVNKLMGKNIRSTQGIMTVESRSMNSDAVTTVDVPAPPKREKIYNAETDLYGPWIVQLEKGYSEHDTFISAAENIHNSYKEEPDKHTLALSNGFKIHKTFRKAINGMLLEGVSKAHLEALPGVKRVSFNGYKYATTYYWGQDRIDQASLPLNYGTYSPDYDGTGVDVYVLDTGLDSDHEDFNTNTRTVANVFNAYGAVDSDTDGHYHGTHCAGTVGGQYSGVAKNANIYGVKVLSDQGSGSDADIIDGIEYVLDHLSGRPSVISMSLGGPCNNYDCSDDSTMDALDEAIDAGVVVVVAAGNEFCNSQATFPSASARAIVVGASDSSDAPAYFSNYGQFVDIYAPGYGIYSSCSYAYCSTETQYISLSGTSMACPHVAGVVAQLLEKDPSATPEDVYKALLCDATKQKISLQTKDTVSRNLLLQTPQNDGEFGVCNLGNGCSNNCSDHGYCAPAHSSSAYGTTANICFCDAEYAGDTCEMSATDYHDQLCDNGLVVKVYMDPGNSDVYGTGWEYANFGIYDQTAKLIVDHALDAICIADNIYSSAGLYRTYCLAEGCYTMDVSSVYYQISSSYNSDNHWWVCDVDGDMGTTGNFCVVTDSETNELTCNAVNPNSGSSSSSSGSSMNWTLIVTIIVIGLVFLVGFVVGVYLYNRKSDSTTVSTTAVGGNASFARVPADPAQVTGGNVVVQNEGTEGEVQLGAVSNGNASDGAAGYSAVTTEAVAVALPPLHVTVPEGVTAGQTLAVVHPGNGQTYHVTVPHGAMPGTTLAVNV